MGSTFHHELKSLKKVWTCQNAIIFLFSRRLSSFQKDVNEDSKLFAPRPGPVKHHVLELQILRRQNVETSFSSQQEIEGTNKAFYPLDFWRSVSSGFSGSLIRIFAMFPLG